MNTPRDIPADWWVAQDSDEEDDSSSMGNLTPR